MLNFTMRHSSFLCATAFLSLTLAMLGAVHAEDLDRPDGYPPEFHDKAYTFVVGTVLEFDPQDANGFEHYRMRVISDLRGFTKEGDVIFVRGVANPQGGISHGSDSLDAAVGQTVVFFVKRMNQAGWMQHVWVWLFPFGVCQQLPAIPPADVGMFVEALKEFAASLDVPGGLGMSRERARALLTMKNPYLWALGCWRLVRDAELDDIALLTSQFGKHLRPEQALYLDQLFGEIKGDASGSAPSPERRCQLFRQLLRTYAKEDLKSRSAAQAPSTTRPVE
jgi:hypothetical protein